MKKIDEWLKKEHIIVNVELNSKYEVLQAISSHIVKLYGFKNISENDILAKLMAREKLGTTGFGEGIAIPHCRIKGINDFIVGIVTLPNGVNFEADDEEKVKLVVYIIAPESDSDNHIRLLSSISRVCKIPAAIKDMIDAKDAQSLRDAFFGHLKSELHIRENRKKSLFHIVVGNKDIFNEILQIFTAVSSSSVTVVEARQPHEFLTKIPLFMGFWDDIDTSAWQIIMATMDKAMVNETIRKIESISGDLNSRKDILVTVQELYYTAGAIKT
ncbi:MAG: PTS sugar transporter subunit IIA [bacterium]|nr:PTS sugar transporter subunit IIA [bacterium]